MSGIDMELNETCNRIKLTKDLKELKGSFKWIFNSPDIGHEILQYCEVYFQNWFRASAPICSAKVSILRF